jgi:hypothetical protein
MDVTVHEVFETLGIVLRGRRESKVHGDSPSGGGCADSIVATDDHPRPR